MSSVTDNQTSDGKKKLFRVYDKQGIDLGFKTHAELSCHCRGTNTTWKPREDQSSPHPGDHVTVDLVDRVQPDQPKEETSE